MTFSASHIWVHFGSWLTWDLLFIVLVSAPAPKAPHTSLSFSDRGVCRVVSALFSFSAHTAMQCFALSQMCFPRGTASFSVVLGCFLCGIPGLLSRWPHLQPPTTKTLPWAPKLKFTRDHQHNICSLLLIEADVIMRLPSDRTWQNLAEPGFSGRKFIILCWLLFKFLKIFLAASDFIL